jgi:hypothetical protein
MYPKIDLASFGSIHTSLQPEESVRGWFHQPRHHPNRCRLAGAVSPKIPKFPLPSLPRVNSLTAKSPKFLAQERSLIMMMPQSNFPLDLIGYSNTFYNHILTIAFPTKNEGKHGLPGERGE